MKLSTRGRYGLKAMLDLSLLRDDQPTSVRAIAQRQQLPAPYLEKLLIALRQAGLVTSVRGAQGGYRLARSPAQISLGQILAAVGETLIPLAHQPVDSSARAEDWVSAMLWQRLSQQLQTALYSISLEELYYDARSWQAAQGADSSFMV